MEGELWTQAYRIVRAEGNVGGGRAGRRVVYADAVIVLVLLWAALHDRPVGWACDPAHWSGCGRGRRPRALPSGATMSRRLRTVGVLGLLERVLGRLGEHVSPALLRRLDGKPLPVGGFSKDRDARWGQAVDHKARGYKLLLAWGGGVVPDAWSLGPMSAAEPVVARQDLIPRLAGGGAGGGGGGGYLLGDALYDSNPLHGSATSAGFQLVAPRRRPGAGLAHPRRAGGGGGGGGTGHEPSRLRSIQLLETPAPGERPDTGPAPFARALYDRRGDIERELGGWCSFGGGLAPLPAWARTPHRVAYWCAAKLLLNGLRLCRLRGIAA